jgi:taurine dioxygenase
MRIDDLGPGFAVEVSGIDPSLPVSEADAVSLRALLDKHQLLVLRCPGLDAAAHISFVGQFGPIYDEARDSSSYSLVSNVVGSFPNGRLLFHQDFAFTPSPHRVQSLYAQEVEGAVAPTMFVSNTRAFERLSQHQRDAWTGLTAIHARDATRSGRLDNEFVRVQLRNLPDGDNVKSYPRAIHPVLQRHPRTNMPLLFVNEYYTSHIAELPPVEGEQIIQEACQLIYQPVAIYAHQWQPGDLVIWDNIALQHARSAVKPDTRRTLRRILVNDHVTGDGRGKIPETAFAG